jgi:hypothetical protein
MKRRRPAPRGASTAMPFAGDFRPAGATVVSTGLPHTGKTAGRCWRGAALARCGRWHAIAERGLRATRQRLVHASSILAAHPDGLRWRAGMGGAERGRRASAASEGLGAMSA